MSTAASEGKSEASRGSAPLTPPEKASKSLTFLKSAKANTPAGEGAQRAAHVSAVRGGEKEETDGERRRGERCEEGGEDDIRRRRRPRCKAEGEGGGAEHLHARRVEHKEHVRAEGVAPFEKTAGRLDAEGRGRAGEAQKIGGDRAAGGGERLFVIRAEEPSGGGAHGARKESGEPALFHHAEKAQPHAVGGGEREGERHRLLPARKERGQEPFRVEDEKT